MARCLLSIYNWGKGKRYRSVSVVGCLFLFAYLHVFYTKQGRGREYDRTVNTSLGASSSSGKRANTSDKYQTVMVHMADRLIHKTTVTSSLSSSVELRSICKVPLKLPEYLQKRKTKAQEACKVLRDKLPQRWSRMDRGPSSGILSKLRWDQQHHLVYCHLPKVASSTWAWHLLRGVGLKDEEISAHRNVHILLHERLPPPSVEDFDNGFLSDALAFVVSRHPFQRLISAYKNKIIEAEKRRQHYVDLRKEIMGKYHRSNESATSSAIPTFRDFCEYVADSTEAWLRDMNHQRPPDPHWMPMTYLCSPCNLHYDVFSKLETMEKDTQYIASQCGLEDVINTNMMINPSKRNSSKEDSSDEGAESSMSMFPVGPDSRSSVSDSRSPVSDSRSSVSPAPLQDEISNSSFSVSQVGAKNRSSIPSVALHGSETEVYRDQERRSDSEYLSELSKQEINRVYEIYKFDFEIFGYSIDDIR